MRLKLNVEGEAVEVDVDMAASTARVGTVTVPVKVLDDRGPVVEIEVAGEKFKIEGWPTDGSEGAFEVVVNREKLRVQVLETELGRSAPAPVLTPPTAPVASGPAPSVAGGPGVAVVPPMPGKVLEVRVKEGDTVAAGQPLLVLEAMKMRNEIQSPTAGTVVGPLATPGQVVKAKDVLLRIVPS